MGFNSLPLPSPSLYPIKFYQNVSPISNSHPPRKSFLPSHLSSSNPLQLLSLPAVFPTDIPLACCQQVNLPSTALSTGRPGRSAAPEPAANSSAAFASSLETAHPQPYLVSSLRSVHAPALLNSWLFPELPELCLSLKVCVFPPSLSFFYLTFKCSNLIKSLFLHVLPIP